MYKAKAWWRRWAAVGWAVAVVGWSALPAVGAELHYAGSSSIGDALLPALALAYAGKTGVEFATIKSSDSDEGFAAVKEGRANLGGLSRLLNPTELEAGLANRVIGYDAVVVYVHPQNPVTGLTCEQLRGIFGGAITNWRQVGGADLPIVPVLKKDGDGGGTSRQFLDLVMGGDPVASGTLRFPSHQENIAHVASNPSGITIGALAFDAGVAKIVAVDGVVPNRETLGRGEYVLGRPYLLVFRDHEDAAEVKKFVDFVFTAEGQKIVGRHVIPVMADQ